MTGRLTKKQEGKLEECRCCVQYESVSDIENTQHAQLENRLNTPKGQEGYKKNRWCVCDTLI